jgi:hypothetical protein
MVNTPNYNLYKPNRADNLPVDTTLSDNFTIIDTEIKNRKDEITSQGTTINTRIDGEVDTLEKRIDNIIANSGTSDTEVVDARGNYTVLNQRLNDVDVKLGEKATQANLDDLVTKYTNYVNARILSSQPQRSNYLLFDSFARADSTTSLGNAETNNTGYSLLVQNSTVWGIQGNSAYVVSTSAAGRNIAYQESNESDCIIEADVTLGTSSNNGLSFRVTDINNFWLVTLQPSWISLTKYVAGASTAVATVNKTYTSGKLSVLMKGNKIEIYMDGFLITKTYDSFNSTATKHGLFSRAEGFDFRWDNFCIKPLGQIPFYVDEKFETSLTKWYWTKETPGMSYSQTFSSTIKETGSTSLRLELRQSDPEVGGSKRSEITLPSESPLEEHWYGVSIYLPNGTEDFALDTSAESLIQWHTTPDSGEQNVTPPLALLTQNGRYLVSMNYDAGRMSSQSNPYTLTAFQQDIGSYTEDKGKWVRWAFHIRWGWLGSQNPITEVYKDGQLVFQYNGYPNCMNDQIGVYPKVGIYKWDWHYGNPSLTTSRVVYYDNFWMK